MTGPAPPPYRLRGPRAGLIRQLVAPPAAMGALAPALEVLVRGSIAADRLAFSAMMLLIAGLGLCHALTRATLVTNETGLCWSRGFERRRLRWSEIEEIGAAGRTSSLHDSRDLGFRRCGTTANPGGSREPGLRHGYDVVLANEFDVATQLIIEELRSRWRRHRQLRA